MVAPQELGQAGADDGGGDRVDADTRPKLEGEVPGDVDQRGLARVVDAHVLGHPDAADRAGVHDGPAVRAHPRANRERGPQDRRPQVGVHHLGEARVILVDQRAVRRVGAGVADQDVQAAEPLDRERDTPPRRVLVGGVRLESGGVAGDLLGRLVGGLLLAGGEHDAGAGLR
jgi:hypothetical protein